MPTDREIYSTLGRYWGYSEFRPCQLDIIRSVLDGADTLGLLPTGGGKSVTFQIPALLLPGLTIVVTPLISLMKDQVDNLRSRGISAIALHSGLTAREQRLALQKIDASRVTLLYISPEKIQGRQWADISPRLSVSLIVVDEAHCISQWGYDFRPSYLNIAALRKQHPAAPVLALTASATPEVAADICRQLAFREGARSFSRSFSRPNISYIVRHADHKAGMLLRVLRTTSGSAIVYVRSRRRTREIADALQAAGISAAFYHAGLMPEEKAERQDAWRSGAVRVMVATNAFGMGIDKPDVRVVAHLDLPSSLEEYYQEAGRAGRDGLPAFAVLIVSRADKGLLTRRVTDAFPERDFILRVYDLAGAFLGVAVGSGMGAVCDFNLELFCSRHSLPPVPTVSALKLLGQAGYLEYLDDMATRPRVMMLMARHTLYDLRLAPVTEQVLTLLLRTCAGIFADYCYIDEASMARLLSLTDDQVYQALLALARMKVIHYVPRRLNPCILFTTRRELPRYVQLPDTVYRLRRQAMERRIEAMKRFAYDTTRCRVATMLEYFGQPEAQPCGTCDVCRATAAVTPAPPRGAGAAPSLQHTIIYRAGQPGGFSPGQLAQELRVSPERLAEALRPMLDDGDVALGPDGRVTLPG